MNEYEKTVLEYIALFQDHRVHWYVIQNHFGVKRSELTNQYICSLIRSGLVQCLGDEKNPMSYLRPTTLGLQLLEQLHDEADQAQAQKEAEQKNEALQSKVDRKKQFRHDWWVAIVGGLVASVLTLVFTYLFDVFISQ